MKLSGSKCAKCGSLMLYRPDKLPFCSECEKKMCADFAKRRPDIAKKGKIVLVSEAVDSDS